MKQLQLEIYRIFFNLISKKDEKYLNIDDTHSNITLNIIYERKIELSLINQNTINKYQNIMSMSDFQKLF